MPWSPVFIGLGVACFFALKHEPGGAHYAGFLAMAALFLLAALRWREVVGPFALAGFFFAFGLLLAGLRTHLVAGPVLDFRYYGAIEGDIVSVDRSGSNAVRLTLEDVVLERMAPGSTPARVRVSLFGDQDYVLTEPGTRVMLTGHLSPPGGPAEPGGFDFQRHAWYLQLGGVGYTRSPVLMIEPRAPGAHWITHFRLRLSGAIQDRIDGQAGAFAAAVTTGDRSGLSPETLDHMRGSNIAHLLAISGLHMGLLTGFVFAALRMGMAAVPSLALHYPIRKWAAFGALVTGAAYLAMSGGNVATERAFIQVSVMLVAVMLDRRAITLRSVAIAAVIVLMRRPETLLSPGFQMSFAATAALVAVFTGLRDNRWIAAQSAPVKWVLSLVISSLVAGLATAPFSAASFNILSSYGLAANLVAVPIMGVVVVPMAVLAALLAPFGLEGPALWVMEQGLIVILWVAAEVTSWPGAVRPIIAPPSGVMAAMVLGGLWWIIWRGRAAWLGALPVLCAIALWPFAERPAMLISDTGGLVGVLADEGRALSRARGDGFVAGIWLENDGERASQEDAAARPIWESAGRGQVADWSDWRIWHGTGSRAWEERGAGCAGFDVIVTNQVPEGAGAPLPQVLNLSEDCLIISPQILRRTGALAISEDGAIETARAAQGARLWSEREIRRDWGYD